MFKKLAVLLLAFVLVWQTVAPSAVLANEYGSTTPETTEGFDEFEALDEATEVAVDSDVENTIDEEAIVEEEPLVEVETAPDEAGTIDEGVLVAEETAPDEAGTIGEGVLAAEENITIEALVADWTLAQLAEFEVLLDAYFDVYERVENLLFFGEGEPGIEIFDAEFWVLLDEFLDLLNEIEIGSISFADAATRLIDQTEALEDLAIRIEATGIVVLPDFDAWTAEQIEAWYVLINENLDILELIWSLLDIDIDFDVDDIEEWDAHWDEMEALFGSLIDEFFDLSFELSEIMNDAIRSRLTFEEAVALLAANLVALEELLARFEAVMNESGEQSQSRPLEEDESNDVVDEGSESTGSLLPQTGTAGINTVLSGVALVGIGATLTVAKNKKE